MYQSFIHFQGGMKALTIPPFPKTGGGIYPPIPPGLTPMLSIYLLLPPAEEKGMELRLIASPSPQVNQLMQPW